MLNSSLPNPHEEEVKSIQVFLDDEIESVASSLLIDLIWSQTDSRHISKTTLQATTLFLFRKTKTAGSPWY
ncbi:hypothetical protein Hanom_Chr09g00797521 [Helianthus anomalus]